MMTATLRKRSELLAVGCAFAIALNISYAAKIAWHAMVEPMSYIFFAFFVVSAIVIPLQMLHGHYTGRF